MALKLIVLCVFFMLLGAAVYCGSESVGKILDKTINFFKEEENEK